MAVPRAQWRAGQNTCGWCAQGPPHPLCPTGHSACLGPRAAGRLKPGHGWHRGWRAHPAAVGDRSAAWEGSHPHGPRIPGGPGRQPSPGLDGIKGCFSLDRGDLIENAPRNQIIPKGQGPETAALGLSWGCEVAASQQLWPAAGAARGDGDRAGTGPGTRRPQGAARWRAPVPLLFVGLREEQSQRMVLWVELLGEQHA